MAEIGQRHFLVGRGGAGGEAGEIGVFERGDRVRFLMRGRIRPIGDRIGNARGGFLGDLVVEFELGIELERLIDLEQQLVGGQLVGHFLPVDHAIDEVDRLVVAREGQQDPAIEDRHPGVVDELGLEPDRRLIGEDLHVVIGDAAQQRARRHVGKPGDDHAIRVAFRRELFAKEAHRRIVDTEGEIEQHRMRAEIGEIAGIKILNAGEHVFAEQARPMVVGAHLHAALVLADGMRRELAGASRLGAVVLAVLPAAIRGRIGTEGAAQSVHGCKSAPW